METSGGDGVETSGGHLGLASDMEPTTDVGSTADKEPSTNVGPTVANSEGKEEQKDVLLDPLGDTKSRWIIVLFFKSPYFSKYLVTLGFERFWFEIIKVSP